MTSFSFCGYATMRWFGVIFVFVGLLTLTNQQTLFGSVQSVTTYDSCSVSPLAESPLKFGSPNTSYASPCDSVGMGQTITEVRLTVFPNRVPNQDQLVFSTSFSPKHTNQADVGGTYNIDDVCGGVPVGGNCSILNDNLVITIESTSLYSDYQLLRRAYNAPYAYEVAVCQTNQNDPSDTTTPFYLYGTTQCKEQSAVALGCMDEGVNVGGVNTGGQSASVCPASVSSGNQFYTPPSSKTLSTACQTLFCRTQQPNLVGVPWVSMTPYSVYPICSIFDIQQRPSGKMNIRLTVNNGTQSQQVLLSTSQSGSVQAIPGEMFARINRINTGAGIIGNTVGGAVVTCKSEADANPNQMGDIANGILNDAATSDADGFTIANPYYSQACPKGQCSANSGTSVGLEGITNCNLPAAKCRANIGADNPNSMWYYVPPEFLTQYGLGCNQNGIKPESMYNRPSVQLQVCEAASFCQKGPTTNTSSNDCSPGTGTCIPGFQQFVSEALRPSSHTFTPCQVSQQFASHLAKYVANDFDGYFWMPPGFDPEQPNWWLVGDTLRSYALGGSSNEVSVDLSIYIVGQFLGEIQTASTGVFAGVSQVCSTVQGGGGTAVANVRNTGASPGNFLVTATFNSTEAGASFTIESTGLTTLTGNVATIVQPIAVADVAQFLFEYTYEGSDTNAIAVTFVLFTLAGNGELVQLQTTSVGCDVVAPIKFVDGQGAFNFFDTGGNGKKPCSGTFNILCWTNLSFGDWVGHLVAIAILLIPAIMIIMILSYLTADAVIYTKRVRLAHQERQLKTEAQQIGERKGKEIAQKQSEQQAERVDRDQREEEPLLENTREL